MLSYVLGMALMKIHGCGPDGANGPHPLASIVAWVRGVYDPEFFHLYGDLLFLPGFCQTNDRGLCRGDNRCHSVRFQ